MQRCCCSTVLPRLGHCGNCRAQPGAAGLLLGPELSWELSESLVVSLGTERSFLIYPRAALWFCRRL